MATCKHPRCHREAVATGYCMKHYRQARAGRLIVEPEIGDPSGKGRYGVLDEDGYTVMCHECGEWKRRLGAHVRMAHDISPREYKIKHGLPLSRGLTSKMASEEISTRAKARVGGAGWKKLEEKRDPTKAAHAREFETMRGSVRASHTQRAVQHIDGQRKPTQRYTCIICGREFEGAHFAQRCGDERCTRIHAYRVSGKGPRGHEMRDKHAAGESYSALGREYGLTHRGVAMAIQRFEQHLEEVAALREERDFELMPWEK